MDAFNVQAKDGELVLPGAPRGYLLPLTQDPKLLWPGWDTLRVQGDAAGFNVIDIAMTKVAGPGKVPLFSSSMTGIKSLLKDGGFELKSGSVIEQGYSAHTHTNWVFEQAGTHSFSVKASDKTKAGVLKQSNTATYTFR